MKKMILLIACVFALAALCGAQTDIINVITSDSVGYPTQFGNAFTVRGIVTSVNLDANRLQFYLQDSTAAVYVDKPSSSAWYASKSLAPGADVTVTGTLGFYNGSVQLTPDVEADIVNNGTGVIPDPVIRTIDDLQDLTADNQARFNMRGRRIKIENVYLATGSNAWPASGSDANITIAIGGVDNTPTGTMRIDKDTDCDENTEPVWPQTVTGVMTQYDNSSPYYSSFQISPMFYSGFETYASVDNWEIY